MSYFSGGHAGPAGLGFRGCGQVSVDVRQVPGESGKRVPIQVRSEGGLKAPQSRLQHDSQLLADMRLGEAFGHIVEPTSQELIVEGMPAR